jgi:hypothetical protein
MQTKKRARLRRPKASQKQLMCSQAFHRTPYMHVRGTATWKQFEPKNLEFFDLVAPDKTGLHLQESSRNWKIALLGQCSVEIEQQRSQNTEPTEGKQASMP